MIWRGSGILAPRDNIRWKGRQSFSIKVGLETINVCSSHTIIANTLRISVMVKREAHNLETVIACLGSTPRSATKNEFIETGLNLWSESVPDGRCPIW